MDYAFSDAEFMSADDKRKVLKQWRTFLESGLKQEKFTKRLYQHLHLHCGFIAHYNINGFYGTYFNGNYEDVKTFFSHFEGEGYHYTNDYEDINKAMAFEYQKRKGQITKEAERGVDIRFALLKECMKRAETDIQFRREFISKVYP